METKVFTVSTLRGISLNINGLNYKIDSLIDLINDLQIDLVLLQETKCTNLNHLRLPDFNLWHVTPFDPESDTMPYHGVATFVRKTIKAERVGAFSKPEDVDVELFNRFLAVELVDHDVVVLNSYLPATRSDLNTEENNNRLHEALAYAESCFFDYTNLIVAGDMNVDCLRDKDSPRVRIFRSYFDRFHALDCNLTADLHDTFTFRSFMNDTTIRYLDRWFTSVDPSCLSSYKILHEKTLGSDHVPVFCELKLSIDIEDKVPITQAQSCRINWQAAKKSHIEAFRRTVTKQVKPLIPTADSDCDNSTLQALIRILESAAQNHIPKVKKRRINSVASELWMTNVKAAQSEFQSWSAILACTSRSDPNYNQVNLNVKRSKLEFKRCAKNYKRQRDRDLANRTDVDSKTIFGSIKKPSTTLLNPPKLLGNASPPEQLAMWERHFTKTFQGSDRPKPTPTISEKNIPIEKREVQQAITKIDTSKSYSRHYIWKHAPNAAIDLLTVCFNAWLEGLGTENQPWNFLHATIGPILKSNDKPISETKSYRPISQATSECFLLEQICLARCLKYFDTCDNQFGYKSGHSTLHAIQIAKKIGTLKDAHVALLDASAAFDTISHKRIQEELNRRKVPENLQQMILGLTFGSHFTIRWFGICSTTPIFPGSGVKQGGVLSAYLFAICYDPLLLDLRKCTVGVELCGTFLNVLVYADDILLVAGSSAGLHYLYGKVMKFAGLHQDISMNASKSKIIRVGTHGYKPMSFEGIPTDVAGKYLGTYLAENRLADEFENRRCRGSLFRRYNVLLRNSSHLRNYSNKTKKLLLTTYGTPYAIETMESVSSLITNPHRKITQHLWPSSYNVRDAGGFGIRSRTLYHVIALVQSLPERHRLLRNNYLLKCKRSKNRLIRDIIGRLPTINGQYVNLEVNLEQGDQSKLSQT